MQSLINVRFSANTVIKISTDKISSGSVIGDLSLNFKLFLGARHSTPTPPPPPAKKKKTSAQVETVIQWFQLSRGSLTDAPGEEGGGGGMVVFQV